MAEQVYLDWNATNWVTITLMALVSFAILGFAMKLWQKNAAKKQPKTPQPGA